MPTKSEIEKIDVASYFDHLNVKIQILPIINRVAFLTFMSVWRTRISYTVPITRNTFASAPNLTPVATADHPQSL